jgi:bifunctional enzyme CysN/CysC
MQFAPTPRAIGPGGHDLLRLLICGSVDDGKSSLIGRLLLDSRLISEDQLSSLEHDAKRLGLPGGKIDPALLTDGLEAEREQNRTIDVADRFFSTPRRSFIVADTPDHEQYTRNMVTGASTAQLAIILVDARKGMLVQTRRHAFICSLLGIRHVVLAVNKMDLVDFDQAAFGRIAEDFRAFAQQLGLQNVTAIPLSALLGDNIMGRSDNMPWYGGATLLAHLETVDGTSDALNKPFRFLVGSVNRPSSDVCGYAGTVASGSIGVGEPLAVAGSGQISTVRRIVTYDGDLDRASAGATVTLVLSDEVDAERGDVFAAPQSRPTVADQFAAHIVWMSDEHLVPGRSYLCRFGIQTVPATVTAIKHRVDVNTLDHLAAKTLSLNDIAFCNVATGRPIAFDPYAELRGTGSFIIIDRVNNRTLGAGMIAFGLRRATNVHAQKLLIAKEQRSVLKNQKPVILWFTGLSGAGKSTIANLVEERLHTLGHHTMLLDGDNVRHGLCRDLGFTEEDRVENIRRAGEVAKLMTESGLIVLCSFISPYNSDRRMVRELVEPDEFIEIFVDTPIEECMKRDPKGLYAKAKAGQIKNFTGFDAPYEVPDNPELHLLTLGREPEQVAKEVVAALRARDIIPAH